MAGKLQDLGFGVERKRDDFEIAGIPKDVLGRFSRRTALIEKLAAKLGITDPHRKDGLGAETREHKDNALSWESLRREWDARLSDKERKMLAAVHRREHPVVMPEPGEKLAVSRPDDPMSATELNQSAPQKPALRERLAFARGLGVFGGRNDVIQQPGIAKTAGTDRGLDHDR